MKGLLLRVGIDKGVGGCLGPIFSDGSFEYIPIPERCATSERRTYRHLIGRSGRPLSDFVPMRFHNSIPHIDPEFETFTYGDPTRNKRRQLAQLSRDDLLIFYAGLEPREETGEPRLYIIGYFTVQHVYDFGKIPNSERASIFSSLPNNAHSKRTYFDDGLVIIKGDPNNSKLLSHAVLLGDANDNILDSLEFIFGFSVSLRRAIGHWIKEPYIQKVRSWLNECR
jgi:hypothetical protein